MSLLPWPRLLADAIGLGIPPKDFWALSVAEWRVLCGPQTGLDQAGLARLSAAYPDEEIPTHDATE